MRAKVTVRKTTYKDIVVEVDVPDNATDHTIRQVGIQTVIDTNLGYSADCRFTTDYVAIAVDKE
jgi:hypothetical protein